MKKCLTVLLSLLLLAGCGAPSAPSENSVEFFAMDTYMTIRAYGADDELLRSAEELTERLEAELSATREDSALYILNSMGGAELSEDAAYLLRRALELCAETDGALDVSIRPIMRAWGFATADDEHRVPGAEEIEALLRAVDHSRVALDGNTASLLENMEIDLGAVTKGYTGDRIAALLRSAGVTSALLDLGGNIQTVGTKPDGSDWRVAIRDPEGSGYLGVLSVSDSAVVTSGGYERYFIDDDGNLWWHIMDPATGYPARNGLVSVTAVGAEGLYCDALATALFIMGPERAEAFWREHGDFEMLLATEDGRLLLSPGLAGCFTQTDGSPYTLETLR